MSTVTLRPLLIAATASLVAMAFAQPGRAQFQLRDLIPGRPAAQVEQAPAKVEEKADDTAEEKETDETDTGVEAVTSEKKPPVDPHVVRFHLMDGSIISGKPTIDEIEVTTEFGKLVVPITSIESFKPGLDSYPEKAAHVEGLIEQLGSDDYKTREEAQKVLTKMGLTVQNELKRRKEDDNAERKRRIEAILKEFETLEEEQADLIEEGEDVARPWIRDDTVTTTRFTVVGAIAPKEFTVQSKYGPLTVKMSDIRLGDRDLGVADEIRRRLDVSGSDLAQVNYKSSGVRLEAGDKVSVTADGQIVMSPWGSNSVSTPDGGQNYGWFVPNKIPGGALVARIGSSGEPFKVGSKHSFVAKRGGLLYFAVAMQGQYAQQGYSFPGQYSVRVKVESK